ncbi:SNF2 family N-terminal domain [Nesidiocoris tenuis]|uniref:SNF2 family N-terminal domain n=2 Tax=Nesidiocoris tenuis TaxID=355587 RepID=A0ABN7ATD6_9HEMI|nr:SNF2 family N-terminal domain [Nesidiocoris tenuis]
MSRIEHADALFDYVKKAHQSQKNRDASLPKEPLENVEKGLKVTLREYQEDAVRWMLSRERYDPADASIDRFSFEGSEIVFSKGGILADEMGLGKTVEVIACILSNPCIDDVECAQSSEKSRKTELDVEAMPNTKTDQDDDYRPRQSERRKRKLPIEDSEPKKKKSGLMSSKYDNLRAWYEQNLSGSSASPTKRSQSSNSSRLKCFCDKCPDNDETIRCEKCSTEQHFVCVDSPDPEDYLCPWCWTKYPPINSGATLIVSPASISNQWIEEIARHVKNSRLNVLYYEGVKNRKYIKPKNLAAYDIVITTYQVLSAELNYVNQTEPVRRLRHEKKYHVPASPLICVKWWRLCLDEAQMVEGNVSRTASMASHIHSVYRWAVTGTPIQKSINDLYGLVRFLNIEPFNDQSAWYRLIDSNGIHGSENEAFRFIAQILWRSIKKDVYDQIGIPPQSTVDHWLRFSPVEGYFYQRIHFACSELFKTRIASLDIELDTKIKDFDRSCLNKILMPLLSLRQACTHPQVIRGKYVKLKHTLTMEELMTDMVAKAKIDVANALRISVSSLNGLAGISWLVSDFLGAADCYRKILHLKNEYEYLLKVDTLQLIHTMHNLAELLDLNVNHLPPTLRDSTLRQDAVALEESYLKKSEDLVVAAREKTSKLTKAVNDIAKGRPLGYSGWWRDLLESVSDDELLNRITTQLDDNHNQHGQSKFSLRVRSLHGALNLIAVWLADADNSRTDALKSVSMLHTIPKEDLSREAAECHLGKRQRRKKNKVCRICSAQEALKNYEVLIFSVHKKEDVFQDELEDEENLESFVDSNPSGLAELRDVDLFGKSKEGSWKPVPQEIILRVLANYAKSKRKLASSDADGVNEPTQHLLLLETVKKEFKCLRNEWGKISNLVAAKDELCMAKLRLRFPNEYEIQKKTDVHVIQQYEIPGIRTNLECELMTSQDELKRTAGILLYLKKLQEKGSSEHGTCPVCQEQLSTEWSVLRCGHCMCFDCIRTLLEMSPSKAIECPLCRYKTLNGEVSCVVAAGTSEWHKSGIKIVGSYSTKVEAVTCELIRLRNEDPDVKVIVFSTWEQVLNVISDALQTNNISFRRLGSSSKYSQSLAQFKSGSVTALLIPLALGSKGLNITEATHVFLAEPILNPADELQAIGRVHRIGQTKPTYVHRFIVHDTVEEKMIASVDPDGWSDGNVTVSELFNLFKAKSD